MSGLLRVHPTNPRYFTDDSGRGIFLAGSNTWPNFVDSGIGDPPPVFGYSDYLSWLRGHGHNFTRLWTMEGARWSSDSDSDDWWLTPNPYMRTGPGDALDGKLKYDLTQFNQTFFDRLRSRCQEAWASGIYTSVMLAGGSWEAAAVGPTGYKNGWDGHPYNSANNINGLDGDVDNDGEGLDAFDTTNPAQTYWLALMEKIVDTINDLDHIIIEIANEVPDTNAGRNWSYAMVDATRGYELTKPNQHVVWMSACWPAATDDSVYGSTADVVSPNMREVDWEGNPPLATGNPIVLIDTDHTSGVSEPILWPWKAFCRGHHLSYMDIYDGVYIAGFPATNDDPNKPDLLRMRPRIGACVRYAARMNLTEATPSTTLATTTYCLAEPHALAIYNPTGAASIDVTLTTFSGTFHVEWYSNELETTSVGPSVAGGGVRTLTPPSSSYDVVFLYTLPAVPTGVTIVEGA